MFEAKRNIGEGPESIEKGEVYELEMIYASQRNPEKGRIELISRSTGFLHIVTAKQLNEDFTELD